MPPPSTATLRMRIIKSTKKANTRNPNNQAGCIPLKHGLQISSSYNSPADSSSGFSLLLFLEF